MTEQDKKITSLEYFYDKITSFEYFYDKVLNASDFYQIEYREFMNTLKHAKEMYEQEIEEAKKVAFEKGFDEGVKHINQLIMSDERFPF